MAIPRIPRVVNHDSSGQPIPTVTHPDRLADLEKKARAMQADINFSLVINMLNLIIISVLLVRALWA